ncbi:DUF2933 domain-containing protein [Alsobacter sp. R-9]
MSHHDLPHGPDAQRPFWSSPAGLGLAVLLAVAAFYLLTEHQAHLFGVLPYLFLLACPLMHMFMHRGHHHHGAAGAPPRGPGGAGRQDP